MLWIKALHLIFMVTWFAGLFYLPRLYVYHAMSNDNVSILRFKTMERKLYYGIMSPGAVLTLIFGLWLFGMHYHIYLHQLWMWIKIGLIAVLVIYHLYLGHLLKAFKYDTNQHSHVFYRWLNEFPVVILVAVIILAVVQPNF